MTKVAKKYDFKKVKWEKKNTGSFFKFEKPGDTLQGLFQKVKTGKYKNQTTQNIVLTDSEGKEIVIGGSAVLLSALEGVKKDTPVKIVYLGKPKGKRYKNFDVFTG